MKYKIIHYRRQMKLLDGMNTPLRNLKAKKYRINLLHSILQMVVGVSKHFHQVYN